MYTFYLSSEYERTEWLRSLQEVQKALPPNPLMLHRDAKAMSMAGLQGYLTKNRQHLQVINCKILLKINLDMNLTLLIVSYNNSIHLIQFNVDQHGIVPDAFP